MASGHGPGCFAVAAQKAPLLYFCGSAGRFSHVPEPSRCHLPTPGFPRVLNSAAAGRRLARRAVGLQALVTLATALACLLSGREAAAGALAGGAAMTLGSAIAAWGAFGGGVEGAGMALGRLLLGTAAKWVVVVAGLYLAIAAWHLPALPVLAGTAMAALAFLVGVKLFDR